jgi:uncharacterized protein (DUF58 family)
MNESKIHGPRMSDIPRYSLKQYLGLMVFFYGSFVFLTYPAYASVLLLLSALALLTFKFNGGVKPPALFTSKAKKQ